MRKRKLIVNNDFMKKNILKIVVCVLGFFTLGCFSSFVTLNSNDSIIGVWIAEDDNNSKLIFLDNGKCEEYYENKLESEYNFSISNNSTQCNESVHTDGNTSYLRMVDVNNNDEYCYEINGITSTKLSLRFLNRGGFVIYSRQ